MIVKYKNKEYNITDYGRIISKRIGNLNNPACPYYILDQLDGATYVREKFIDDYLMDRYGLTTERYYNLVVNGNPDKINTCPNCNRKLEFKGLRFQGHGGYRHYCNSKCQGEHYVKLGISNFQIRRELNEKVCSERMKILNLKMLMEGTHPLKDKHSIILRARDKYRSDAKKYNWNKAYFYIAICKDTSLIKIGITQSITGRLHDNRSNFKYFSIHKLRYGSIEDITELEYQVKLSLMKYSIGSYEVFSYDKIKLVLKLVKDFK